MPPRSSFRTEVISVTTNGSGAASVSTDRPIQGEIMAIGYVKDTINASTSPTVATKNAPIQTLDSGYDVNGGSAVRYVRAAVQGSSAGDNKWCPFIVDDTITVTITGGATSKHMAVVIYYRQLN